MGVKNNSLFHAKLGSNGCPAFNATPEGGQGRSARLRDLGLLLPSKVDSDFWSKDAVEVGYVTVRPQSLLMVTEKKKAYALGEMLVKNQNFCLHEGWTDHYGFKSDGIVGEGGAGMVARQAVFADS